MRFLTAALALVLAATPAAAQWMPAGPTNATPSLFAANSRAVFAADVTALRTVHRSPDDGRTWTNASPTVTGAGTTPTITGLAAHEGGAGATVRSSNGNGTGFYRSANDGASWTRIATLPTTVTYDDATLVATRSGQYALVGTVSSQKKLVVSSDGGATWTVRDSVFGVGAYVIAVGDTLVRQFSRTYRLPSGGYQTTYGIAFTSDLGQTWTFRDHPTCFSGDCQSLGIGSDVRLLAYGAGRLYSSGYMTSDFGLTWTRHPIINTAIKRYAIGAGRVVVGTGSGTEYGFGLQTLDTGTSSWTDVPDVGGFNASLRRGVFWTGRSFLVGLEFGGVVRSEDGVTWAPSQRFSAHHNSSLLAIAAHRGALVASLDAPERFVRSYDHGATWHHDQNLLAGLDDAAGLVSLDSVVLAAGLEGVYRTTDLTTWNRVSTGLRNVDGFVVVNGRVFAGATGGLYERPASGTTWTQVLSHNLNQFDAGVSGSRLIVNGGNGSQRNFRISTDGGTTWGATGTAGGSFQVAATSGGFFTAATAIALFGGGTFRRSLDDGATWHNLKPALGDSLAPTLLDNRGDTLIAIGSTYLAASLDNGTTWRKATHTGLGFTFAPGSTTNAPVSLTRMGDTLYVAFTGQSVWKRSLADLGLTVAADDAARPEAPTLSVAPNPAVGPVAVTLALTRPGAAHVAVYDVLGRQIALLHDGALGAGTHRFVWTGDSPAGVYLVRSTADGASAVRSLVRSR